MEGVTAPWAGIRVFPHAPFCVQLTMCMPPHRSAFFGGWEDKATVGLNPVMLPLLSDFLSLPSPIASLGHWFGNQKSNLLELNLKKNKTGANMPVFPLQTAYDIFVHQRPTCSQKKNLKSAGLANLWDRQPLPSISECQVNEKQGGHLLQAAKAQFLPCGLAGCI